MNKHNLDKTVEKLKKDGFHALGAQLHKLKSSTAESDKSTFAAYLEGLAYMLDEDLRDLQNIGPGDEAYMPRLEEIIALRNLILLALPVQDFSSIDYIDAVYKFHTHDLAGARKILIKIVADNPANHWNALLEEVQKADERAKSATFDIDFSNKDQITSSVIKYIGEPEMLAAFMIALRDNSSQEITSYVLQIVQGLAEQQGYDDGNFRIMLVFANILLRVKEFSAAYLMKAISLFFLNDFMGARVSLEQAVKLDEQYCNRDDYKFIDTKLKELGL